MRREKERDGVDDKVCALNPTRAYVQGVPRIFNRPPALKQLRPAGKRPASAKRYGRAQRKRIHAKDAKGIE